MYRPISINSSLFTLREARCRTKWSLMVNCRSVCLCLLNASLEHVVCDLYLWPHDLENVLSVLWLVMSKLWCFIKVCSCIAEITEGEKITPKVAVLFWLCGFTVTTQIDLLSSQSNQFICVCDCAKIVNWWNSHNKICWWSWLHAQTARKQNASLELFDLA